MKEHQVKAAVRERDGNRCRDCGMTDEEHVKKLGKSLEVHRIIPGCVYEVDLCVLLCRKCHKQKPKTVQTAFWMDEEQAGVQFFFFNLYHPEHRRIYDALVGMAEIQGDSVGGLLIRALESYVERAACDQYAI